MTTSLPELSLLETRRRQILSSRHEGDLPHPAEGLWEVAKLMLEAGDFRQAIAMLKPHRPAPGGLCSSSTQEHFWTWAQLLYEGKEWDLLREEIARAIRVLDSESSFALVVRLELTLAWMEVLSSSGISKMREIVVTYEDKLRTNGPIAALGDFCHLLAYVDYRFKGNISKAQIDIESAIGMYRACSERARLAQTLVLRSVFEKNSGRLRQALSSSLEALRLACELGNVNRLQDATRQAAICALRLGDLAAASELIEYGLRACSEYPDDRHSTSLLLLRARMLCLSGEVAEAARVLAAVGPRLQQSREQKHLAILHEYRGLLHLAEDDAEAALLEFDRSRDILDEMKIVSYERAEIMLRRAEALVALQRFPAAEDECTRALERLEKAGEGLERGHLLRVRGIANFNMGRPSAAREDFERAERELRRVGDLYELGRLLLDKSNLLTDDAEGSVADAAEAANIFDRVGVKHLQEQARDTLDICQIRLRKAQSEAVVGEDFEEGRIIASSTRMKRVLADARTAAPTDGVVLITGETGVGKEIVARYVHDNSDRSQARFVAVNCAAIPETLFERELFGHTKGAFTGAERDMPGLVELANGGTMFLDEIGELPLAMQPKLLRLLQEGTYRRVGEAEERFADIRFVAATNRSLADQVGKNGFREDLFYRLRWFEVEIPPLRDRPEDTIELAKYFLAKVSQRQGITYWVQKDAWLLIKQYGWPGNVRELESAIHSAAIRSGADGCIRVEDLPSSLQRNRRGKPLDPLDLSKQLEARERELILEALQRARYHRTQTARFLGISRSTLHEKMKKHGILPER